MRVQRIRHRAAESAPIVFASVMSGTDQKQHILEADAGIGAICAHEGRIHLHLLLAVAISRLPIPLVFVLAFLGGFGIQLVWQVLDSKGGAAI